MMSNREIRRTLSGKQTSKGKGKQPTKAGLFDKSAPERRRDAQVMMDLAIQAYVKAAIEEGVGKDKIEESITKLTEDAFYLAYA